MIDTIGHWYTVLLFLINLVSDGFSFKYFFNPFQDQICESSDILAEKGITRVANTVAALVAIATHSKQPVPSNV